MGCIGWLCGALLPINQKKLIGAIDQTVDALGQYGGGAGDCRGNELGDRNANIRCKGDDQDFEFSTFMAS